jgi:NAD(P)H-hydrate epimerase
VLVVGGSPGMTGAAVLASRGVLRGGAGRVSCVKLDVADLPAEVTTTVLDPDALGVFVRDTRISALVVGPGLSADETGRRWLDAALALERPLVLDAGALTLLGDGVERLKARTFHTVLTPHPAELGRLLGVSAVDVQRDRIGRALAVASTSGAVVVHKGARTVVVTPDGDVGVVLCGHPVLATGGTGDVLAGIVGALLGKGLEAFNAARLGALLHARAGELCAATAGPEGVLASEIADAVPRVFAELERAA